MTDGPLGEPDFDDPAHDRLRELLSSARVDTPVPADVADRLDATLAELTGRAAPSPPVPEEDDHAVVPLRRRARLAPRLLAAAAVLVVAGAGAVGLTQVLKDDGSDRATSADSASPAESAGGLAATGDRPAQPSAPNLSLNGQRQDGSTFSLARGSVPVLSTADFAPGADGLQLNALTKVQRAAELASRVTATKRLDERSPATATGKAGAAGVNPGPQVPTAAAGDKDVRTSLRTASALARSCAGPRMAGTSSYPIVLDGAPAVLVVHPANAGSKLVEAWSCDGSQVLAFTTVPG